MTALAINNPRVQQLRRLIGRRSSRHDEGRFVVEGRVLVAEAVAAGWIVEAQFVPEGSDASVPSVRARSSSSLLVCSNVSRRPRLRNHRSRSCGWSTDDVEATLATAGLVMVLDRIADPGNLGTIIRSAEAAGVDAVVLTPGSVDPFSPKVVRSSAGALFHVPVISATIDDVATAGLTLVGTSSHAAPGRTVVSSTRVDLTGRVALVMGNEAAGLPDDME